MKKSSALVGYGMLTFLSVILFTPILEFFNTSLPDTSIGNALGTFFWLVYPILILWLIYKTMTALL